MDQSAHNGLADRRVFISYSAPDKAFAAKLARKLKREGIGVWFAEWEIRLGESIVQRVNLALADSDFLLVVLSGDALASKWVQEEMAAGISETIKRGIFLLPVLIGDVEPPPLISHRKYVRFDKDPHVAFHEILVALGARKGTYSEHGTEARVMAKQARRLMDEYFGVSLKNFEELPEEDRAVLIKKLTFVAERLHKFPDTLIPYYTSACLKKGQLLDRDHCLEPLLADIAGSKPYDSAAMEDFVVWSIEQMIVEKDENLLEK